MKLPTHYLNTLMQVVTDENSSVMITCKFMDDSWQEMGPVIIKAKQAEEGWSDKEAPRKAHAWFIESCAAEVGMHPTSMYDRMRVGRNVIRYGHHTGEFENLLVGHWTALLRNVEQDQQGVIPQAILKNRLEWIAQVTHENEGQPPSVRDIQDQYRQNGERREWELYWNAIVRNAKSITNISGTVPGRISRIATRLLSLADVDFTGGTPTN